MSSEAPLTLKTVLTVGIAGPIFVAVGLPIIRGVCDTGMLGEPLLTRHPPARLVTWAAQPLEFVLRCLFTASLGGFFFTAGALGLLALLFRLPPLHRRLRTGRFGSRCCSFLPIYYG